MSSFLRKALGLKHRGHLAVEELSGEEAGAPAEDTVVMKGPLADNFSAALDAVYDKANPAPAEGENGEPGTRTEPPAETGENVDPAAVAPTPGTEIDPVEAETAIPEITQVVLESQAIDAAVVQALAAATTDEAPTDGTDYATLYAIDESQLKPENVVEVTQLLAQADDPENVSVLIADVLPEAGAAGVVAPTAEQAAAADAETEKLIVAVESVVVNMGGKVYRSFGDYIKARAGK